MALESRLTVTAVSNSLARYCSGDGTVEVSTDCMAQQVCITVSCGQRLGIATSLRRVLEENYIFSDLKVK